MMDVALSSRNSTVFVLGDTPQVLRYYVVSALNGIIIYYDFIT